MLTYPTLLIPFCAWLLMGYFKSVPRELEEAARIDGASRFQAMSGSSCRCARPASCPRGSSPSRWPRTSFSTR